MLRYAHTISSASRRLASRHPMFCDPCTAGPRQFYPLRNNNFQSDWIPLAPYYVNGWQDNGPSLYRKIGNCYLVKLSARNGNYETDIDICRNLPFSGSGICVNCFYNVNPDGNGIQVSGNKLFIVRKPTVSMDTIFANFIVGPDV